MDRLRGIRKKITKLFKGKSKAPQIAPSISANLIPDTHTGSNTSPDAHMGLDSPGTQTGRDLAPDAETAASTAPAWDFDTLRHFHEDN